MLRSTQDKCSALSGSNIKGSFILTECKYTKWYWNIIEKRTLEAPEGYCEKHHIIPKFMGGNNKKENLILVTGREHYILHLLLMKILRKSGDKLLYRKSVYSVFCFTIHYHRQRCVIPSKIVEALRKEMSNLNIGRKHDDKAKQKMKENHWLKNGGVHPLLGKNHREASINKMRLSRTKQWWDVYSPDGEYFHKVPMNEIARKYNLNTDCIRKYKGKVIPPVPDHHLFCTKQPRINTTGWLFIPL